jgi:hypothetical protein
MFKDFKKDMESTLQAIVETMHNEGQSIDEKVVKSE